MTKIAAFCTFFAPQKCHCAASVHLRTYLVPREVLSHYGTTKKRGLGSICDTTLTSTFLRSVVETDLDIFPYSKPSLARVAQWFLGQLPYPLREVGPWFDSEPGTCACQFLLWRYICRGGRAASKIFENHLFGAFPTLHGGLVHFGPFPGLHGPFWSFWSFWPFLAKMAKFFL